MMKMGLLAPGLIIACMSVGRAQPPQEPPEQPRAWAAKLFGAPANLVHDFGPAPRGTQLHHDFVMTNIYEVPIEITFVRTS